MESNNRQVSLGFIAFCVVVFLLFQAQEYSQWKSLVKKEQHIYTEGQTASQVLAFQRINKNLMHELKEVISYQAYVFKTNHIITNSILSSRLSSELLKVTLFSYTQQSKRFHQEWEVHLNSDFKDYPIGMSPKALKSNGIFWSIYGEGAKDNSLFQISFPVSLVSHNQIEDKYVTALVRRSIFSEIFMKDTSEKVESFIINRSGYIYATNLNDDYVGKKIRGEHKLSALIKQIRGEKLIIEKGYVAGGRQITGSNLIISFLSIKKGYIASNQSFLIASLLLLLGVLVLGLTLLRYYLESFQERYKNLVNQNKSLQHELKLRNKDNRNLSKSLGERVRETKLSSLVDGSTKAEGSEPQHLLADKTLSANELDNQVDKKNVSDVKTIENLDLNNLEKLNQPKSLSVILNKILAEGAQSFKDSNVTAHLNSKIDVDIDLNLTQVKLVVENIIENLNKVAKLKGFEKLDLEIKLTDKQTAAIEFISGNENKLTPPNYKELFLVDIKESDLSSLTLAQVGVATLGGRLLWSPSQKEQVSICLELPYKNVLKTLATVEEVADEDLLDLDEEITLSERDETHFSLAKLNKIVESSNNFSMNGLKKNNSLDKTSALEKQGHFDLDFKTEELSETAMSLDDFMNMDIEIRKPIVKKGSDVN